MIYLLLDESVKEHITLKGEVHKYLVKVLRHKEGDILDVRFKENVKLLHKYKIADVEGRSLSLESVSSEIKETAAQKTLHIGWCVIDPKSVEKVLPFLNEIGVEKISFIYCDRSQKNFKLDFKRFERILEASMQQCGRTSYMEFETFTKLDEFISTYPDVKVFDFCDNILQDGSAFESVLIGCEGGFSQEEKEYLKKQEVFRLDTPMVLRSETAVVSVASKILL